MTEVTRILSAIDAGDAQATERLLPLVYDELRRLAARKLSHEKPGQTLQTTALVHEAYIRLVGSEEQRWNSSGHFFAAAAEAMRRILVDSARRKQQHRRGGQGQQVPLDAEVLVASGPSDELLALDEALDLLEQRDAVSAELVKLRYFAGLTMSQAAEALDIPLRTAERTWTYARTWLHRELGRGDHEIPG
jgi:RNA polymerase sigma factor (TIGR02999 family)